MPIRQTKISTGVVQAIRISIELLSLRESLMGIPPAAPTVSVRQSRQSHGTECGCAIHFQKSVCKEAAPLACPSRISSERNFILLSKKPGDDCLKLNVWTPAETTEDKLPVMFWIHGGGLGSGYGHEMEFDGEALCKEGVVLVTINYRVNYFGFFAHPDLSAESPEGVSGNYGMLDQIAALEWVQENIKAFGGDPDNVTIFGQSAGGGSVVSHLSTERTDGLFHKAIIQSGSFGVMSYAMTTTLKDAQDWGVKVCDYLGKTVEDLRQMPVEAFYDAVAEAEQVVGGHFHASVLTMFYIRKRRAWLF